MTKDISAINEVTVAAPRSGLTLTNGIDMLARANRSARANLVGLVAILAFGLVLRCWQLNTQCLTHDEIFEVQAIQQPIAEFAWSPDAFPPLHRISLWMMAQVTSNDMAGRWLAVACGLVTLVALYGTGRYVGGPTAGLAAAGWCAISPLQIYYAQESRAYGMYLAVAACSLWAFVRAYRSDGWGSWCAFVVSVILGELTHYYFALLVICFGMLWLTERCSSQRFRLGIIAWSTLAVFQLLLWPLLRHDLSETIGYPEQTPFSVEALGYTLYSFVAGYTLGPAQTTLHEISSREAIVGFLPYMAILLMVVAGPAWYGFRAFRHTGWVWPLVVLTLVPVLLAGLLSHILHLNYNVRYVVVSSLPLLAAWGVGWAATRPAWIRYGSATSMLALAMIALYNRNYQAAYQNEDVRGAARYLQSQVSTANDRVYVNVGYMARPLRYYLGPEWDVIEFPRAGDPNGRFLTSENVAQAMAQWTPEDSQAPWLVLSRTFHGDPDRLLRNYLQSSPRPKQRANFSGVVIYR